MFTRRILIVLAIALFTVFSGKVLSQTPQGNLSDYPTGFDSEPLPAPNIIVNGNRGNRNRAHQAGVFQENFKPVSGQTEASQKAIQAKIKELQQARAEAKKQLAKAQEELKKGLDLQLEARLILLGLLD